MKLPLRQHEVTHEVELLPHENTAFSPLSSQAASGLVDVRLRTATSTLAGDTYSMQMEQRCHGTIRRGAKVPI